MYGGIQAEMPQNANVVASDMKNAKITRLRIQASGPSGLMNSQASDARKNPMPSPHCIRPTPLPRFLSGQSSATIDVPVTHSEPMATPTRKRITAKEVQSQAKALKPVSSE